MKKKKNHAVNWKNVCKRKELGGFGLKDFTSANVVAMAKLSLHFENEDNSLWARVLLLRGKYSNINHVRHSPSLLWISMRKGLPILTKGSGKVIRNGRDTLFWQEN